MKWNKYPETKPEYNKRILIAFENIHGEIVQCVGNLQSVSQYIGKDTPYHDRFYCFPGWGHEITNVKFWMELPSLRKELK